MAQEAPARLRSTCGERSLLQWTRSTKSGPGQVQQARVDGLAAVVQQAVGVVPEQLLEARRCQFSGGHVARAPVIAVVSFR